MKTVGEIMRCWREENKISASEFIAKMKDEREPISAGYLSQVELHGKTPGPTLLNAIAKITGHDINKLRKITIKQKLGQHEKILWTQYTREYFKSK